MTSERTKTRVQCQFSSYVGLSRDAKRRVNSASGHFPPPSNNHPPAYHLPLPEKNPIRTLPSDRESDNDNGKYSENGAINIVWYEFLWMRIGHVNILVKMLTIACCLIGLGLELGLRLELVFGWLVWLCTRIYTTFHCHCHSSREISAITGHTAVIKLV